MTLKDAIRVLVLGPGRQFPVIGTQSLRLLFEADDANTFNAGLRRIVSAGLLERIARGVFVNRALPDPGLAVIGDIVRNLRPRRFCYLSYESALAEFGSISQVPMVYLIATTGNAGKYSTRYGDIEFSHTRRSGLEILRGTVFDERLGLRVASPELALNDLRRVRPDNLHLVDEEIHAEVVAEWQTGVQERDNA